MKEKLLLFGNNSIHTYNFYNLIKDYFSEILVVVDTASGPCEKLPLKVLDYSPRPQKMWKALCETRRIIRDFRPNVIHGQQINKALFFAALCNLSSKIPMVATAWGSDILLIPKQNWLFRQIVRFVLRKATFLTSDSTYMAREMELVAGKKLDITIANFGIDVPETSAQKQNVIYTNRLHEKLYRNDSILLAFSKFLQNHSDWKLVVAAIGSETENLKKLAHDLKIDEKVQFVGWVEKAQNAYYYSIAKFWISIPESDATAISLLEAMSAGCIPVVSDLPANREWIQDGINGLIVSDIESDFISDALSVSETTAREMNREIVNKNATKAANREKFIGIYERIKEK